MTVATYTSVVEFFESWVGLSKNKDDQPSLVGYFKEVFNIQHLQECWRDIGVLVVPLVWSKKYDWGQCYGLSLIKWFVFLDFLLNKRREDKGSWSTTSRVIYKNKRIDQRQDHPKNKDYSHLLILLKAYTK